MMAGWMSATSSSQPMGKPQNRVRRILRPNDELSFAGPVSIAGTSSFPAGEIPEPMNRDWGLVLGGNGSGLFVSPIDSKRALWSLSYLANKPRNKVKPPFSEGEAKTLLLEALDRGNAFTEPFHGEGHRSLNTVAFQCHG